MKHRVVKLETLREARARRGLSGVETARRASIDRVTLWRLETGRRTPAYATLQALQKVLRVRLWFPERGAS